MHHLRRFTKDFKLCGTMEIPGSKRIAILLIARDGEAWELAVSKDDIPEPSEVVTVTYREVRPCILAVLPEFPSDFEILQRVDQAPQKLVDALFGKEIQMTLEDKLQNALAQEDYKTAAALRDKIKKKQEK